MKYRAEHGSCNVPNKWKENPALGKWVNAQRQYYRIRNEGKATSITAERIAKLEAIGFEWSLRSLTPWEARLEELKAYKEKHGHVLVPQKDKDHRGLARWVDTQRQQARMKRDGKKSQMTDDRIAKLDAIGMKWVTTEPQSWECKLLGQWAGASYVAILHANECISIYCECILFCHPDLYICRLTSKFELIYLISYMCALLSFFSSLPGSQGIQGTEW